MHYYCSRDASVIVADIIDDPAYNKDDDANILPEIALQRKITEARDLADFNANLYESDKKLISIGYGSIIQVIGELEITDSTTYHELKERIKPLVREYLSFSNHKVVEDLVDNFTVLDHHKVPVVGRAAMVVNEMCSELPIFHISADCCI